MTDALRRVKEEYARALKEYLGGVGEPALKRAYELGRRVLTENIGLLELSSAHHEALAEVLRSPLSEEERTRGLRLALGFFAESLSPFEMTQRGFREANAALRRINERLEEETRRFAHALHDEAGPLLVAIHLALKELAREVPPAGRPRLEEVKAHLNRVEDQLRHLAHELRPRMLDDLGLVPALRFLAEGISARNGIHVAVEDRLETRLPPSVETAVYRTVQEALTNVVRHARAKHAKVQLSHEGSELHCAIRDDGVGITAASKSRGAEARGLGLVGIRERLDALGGALRITSVPGEGTELHVKIPLEG